MEKIDDSHLRKTKLINRYCYTILHKLNKKNLNN